jgi:hypothetical protein
MASLPFGVGVGGEGIFNSSSNRRHLDVVVKRASRDYVLLTLHLLDGGLEREHLRRNLALNKLIKKDIVPHLRSQKKRFSQEVN